MNPFRYSVSLRLTHPTINAAEIQEHLQLSPRFSKSVGDKNKSPSGRDLVGTNKQTFCTFELSSGDDSKLALESELSHWTQELSKCKAFLNQFQKSGGTIEYFIGVFLDGNSGVVFSPQEMNSMQELGIGISLDIYP